MRYQYFYRTSANEAGSGWIDAKDRNDAYALLKRQGIRPTRVNGRDPLQWRRWLVIAVLGAALAGVSGVWYVRRERASVAAEARSQIYGDPALIQRHVVSGWLDTFGDPGDAWFARHARPGIADTYAAGRESAIVLSAWPVRILLGDPDEIAKMKRLVNGMKREFAAYRDGGGTQADYMQLCGERIETERRIEETVRREFEVLRRKLGEGRCSFEDVISEWEGKNALLRSFGLQTVSLPLTSSDN